VDCSCGRHFHFGDDLWVRTDPCIVCPSCGKALSPLDFDQNGIERVRHDERACRCWNEGQYGRVHREDCPLHKGDTVDA
jgi:hypothetical protein